MRCLAGPAVLTNGVIKHPLKADRQMVGVALEDLGLAAAVVLAQPLEHGNRTYVLTGDKFSNQELSAALAEVAGRPVKYEKCEVPTAASRLHDPSPACLPAVSYRATTSASRS